eukprot:CAMPEP_0118974190 /NCGR_PEP_ID=MMETSP1173-20130426/11118_1 /TAXON_ID=1034831 /ORGANISM="Rhizochromulina marina cf, Strain CCMP1243" /LENGTH=520 /DNA_ID=CAMNT_0006923899 /DNA_START=41 /DNA_END=1603 /DNA_ORIENTATION=+
MKATAAVLLALAATAAAYPLDDYVQAEDDTFSWVDTGIELQGHVGRFNHDKASWTGRYLNVTTQSWLTAEDSSQPVWWHLALYITADDEAYRRPVAPDGNTTMLMYITGYKNGAIPKSTDEEVVAAAEIAIATGLPAVILFQVPNEPIVFPSDPLAKSRSEDAIIAFTWDHFLNDMSDPTWVLQLPMVKAVMRAQDAIEEYLGLEGKTEWFVSGASKRGWTTWLSAAADANYKKRIIGIAPMVYDMLNFRENLHHQYAAYGGWSFAFKDYYEMNITGRLDDDNATDLFNIVDPFFYKDRLTMPKLVIDTCGDEFFTIDDWAYWINLDGGLPGVNHYLMSPNTEHSEATGILEIVPAIAAFLNGVMDEGAENLPQFTWTVDDTNGDIVVTLAEGSPKPDAVHQWSATTCNDQRRDFRLVNIDDPCTCGIGADGSCLNLKVLWSKEEITASEDGTYRGSMAVPSDGLWGGFLLDLQFKSKSSGLGWPVDSYKVYEFTTQVSIVPNTFPFDDCVGYECYGTLV